VAVYKREGKKGVAFVCDFIVAGQRVNQTIPGVRNLREAKAAEARMRAEVEARINASGNLVKMSLEVAIERYVAERLMPRSKPAAVANYLIYLGMIRDYFGPSRPVSAINNAACAEWWGALLAGRGGGKGPVKANTAKRYLGQLKAVLAFAAEAGVSHVASAAIAVQRTLAPPHVSRNAVIGKAGREIEVRTTKVRAVLVAVSHSLPPGSAHHEPGDRDDGAAKTRRMGDDVAALSPIPVAREVRGVAELGEPLKVGFFDGGKAAARKRDKEEAFALPRGERHGWTEHIGVRHVMVSKRKRPRSSGAGGRMKGSVVGWQAELPARPFHRGSEGRAGLNRPPVPYLLRFERKGGERAVFCGLEVGRLGYLDRPRRVDRGQQFLKANDDGAALLGVSKSRRRCSRLGKMRLGNPEHVRQL
jgi:hypothetical protein